MMAGGSLEYVDDSTILDDADLWRRVHPNQFVHDNNLGRKRPTSAVFEDPSDGSPMSVVLGQEVLIAGHDANSVLQNHLGYFLASFTAGFARSLEQGVVRRPLEKEPAHAEVFGKKTKSVKKKLACEATWVIGPEAESD